MKNKLLFLTSTLFLIFLISLTSVSAYYPNLYDYDLHLRYHYYEDNDKPYPIVVGPFPRYYLAHRDMGEDIEFLHDDFDRFDSFIGYKDLDVFNPDGTIDIIRNPDSRELDLSHIPEGTKTFGSHVSGYIPGPGGSYVMYRKHYQHEHPWDLEVNYDYGYQGYNYYTPFLAYRNRPVQRPGCQSISGCEYRRCYYGC